MPIRGLTSICPSVPTPVIPSIPLEPQTVHCEILVSMCQYLKYKHVCNYKLYKYGSSSVCGRINKSYGNGSALHTSPGKGGKMEKGKTGRYGGVVWWKSGFCPKQFTCNFRISSVPIPFFLCIAIRPAAVFKG